MKSLDEKLFDNNPYNFIFLGSSGYEYGTGHKSRYNDLVKLIKKTDIQLMVSEPEFRKKTFKSIIKDIIKLRINLNAPSYPISYIYPDRCKDPIFGLEMYNLFNNSNIIFNRHTDAAKGAVGNMRLFEATGVGACLLTDIGSNMKDLFEENKEVVTYSCIDEAIEKMQYLLDHEDERKQIALSGQKRTLKDHTIHKRCEQIDEIIKQNL